MKISFNDDDIKTGYIRVSRSPPAQKGQEIPYTLFHRPARGRKDFAWAVNRQGYAEEICEGFARRHKGRGGNQGA